jgi:hypothetical protein
MICERKIISFLCDVFCTFVVLCFETFSRFSFKKIKWSTSLPLNYSVELDEYKFIFVLLSSCDNIKYHVLMLMSLKASLTHSTLPCAALRNDTNWISLEKQVDLFEIHA